MSKDSNNDSKKNSQIVYNNYFLILDPNFIKNTENIASLFKPFKQNFTQTSSFLSKKRKAENKIIINREETNDLEIDVNINKKYEKKEKNINSDNTKDITKEKENHENIDINENENELNDPSNKGIFFEVYKKSKKGRKTQASSSVTYIHTKFSHDNVLRKIKVKFMQKLNKYINNIIISKKDKKINLLKPLSGIISQNNSITYNVKLLSSKIKDIILSNEINGKFKLYDKDYNKKVIESIYKENIQELIDLFEMTFLEVFNEFRNINKTDKLIGFEKIDTVLREIKEKEKNEEYIKKFTSIVNDFEKYYIEKNPRSMASK